MNIFGRAGRQYLDTARSGPCGKVGRRHLARPRFPLSRSEDLGNQHLVGILQAFGQFVEELFGS